MSTFLPVIFTWVALSLLGISIWTEPNQNLGVALSLFRVWVLSGVSPMADNPFTPHPWSLLFPFLQSSSTCLSVVHSPDTLSSLKLGLTSVSARNPCYILINTHFPLLSAAAVFHDPDPPHVGD